ncbi:MAG: PIG-L family deacetylase [Verrucomicrobia bacterium]|nr:PIG-L family deacetylase [Verrucomicrobiota bacterium]
MNNADWLDQLLNAYAAKRFLIVPDAPLPGGGTAVALAPHPDDPDAIAITLRLLQQGGWKVHWMVLNSGWSGVPDEIVGADRGAKGRLREAEERAAAEMFGLPKGQLSFLRLIENDAGKMEACDENRRRFNGALEALAPDLVLLPHGEDTNPDHRLAFSWFAAWMRTWPFPVIGLCNEDPKTENFYSNLRVRFGEEAATWKSGILECHRSQSLRNQRTRGHTFADRILSVNHRNLPDGVYEERFEAITQPSGNRGG